MSQIIVNIPDCDDVSVGHTVNGTVPVTASDCAVPIPGPPPLISWFTVLVIGIVLVAAVIAFALVRYRAHELKPKRLEEQRLARKQELDAQVRMAECQKVCPSCTTPFAPELTPPGNKDKK